MSVTLTFQPTGQVPGNAEPVTMRGGALTIGRGATNDLVLPDPDRMLSKNHCVIEDQGGNVVVVDLSTNGTFLNYSKVPLGPTPTPLSNGDVLTIGLFEVVVSVVDDSPFAQGLPPAPGGAQVSPGQAGAAPDPMALLDDVGPEGDFLDELLGAQDVPTGPSQLNPVDPIDELLPPAGESEDPFFQKPEDPQAGQGSSMGLHGDASQDSMSIPRAGGPSLIPDDWDDFLAPDDPPAAAEPTAPAAAFMPPQAAPAPKAEPAVQPPKAEAPKPTAPPPPPPSLPEQTTRAPAVADPPAKAPASGEPSDAARAFLAAMGMEDLRIDDADLTDTMARAGGIMRLLVEGLREILMTRTSIKSEFRIEQTRIGAGHNNPLKFSISPEQAIESLLLPRQRGYLDPETAAQEALDDVKAHEVAMVAGMESAIKGVLAKLSPEVLAGKIEDSGRIASLLRGKKAQYWDVYEKMYGEISDQAENDFHDFFSREFARAYQEQLNRLKG